MSANPITSTLAALLENAAQTALSLDPAAQAQIAELNEQVLLLELTLLPPTSNTEQQRPPVALRVSCSAVDGGTLKIMADSAYNTRTPNAIVRGSIANFVQALFASDGHALPDGIDIEGDERLLLALQNCFRNLQPNWREPLENFADSMSARFGVPNTASAPPLLQDLLGQAELAFATLRTALTDVVANGKETAVDASAKIWAQDDDVERFATRLEDLQMNVDRLRAEIDYKRSQTAKDSDTTQSSASKSSAGK